MFFQRKQTSGVEWIICCLGNPDREYENTRHNVGFVTADVLSARTGIPVKRIRFKALTGAGEIAGHKVLIMKPNTYMNLSGTALQEAAAFYKVPAERCLVVSDDVTLDPGRLRLRRNGSAGGHNGLKNIIAQLGHDEFSRVRVGVGKKPKEYDMVNWVLGHFEGEDAAGIKDGIGRAVDAICEIMENGVDSAMNKFNGKK